MVEARFKVSPAVVEKYLAGVDYPASRQDLIDKAKKNKADRDVMDILDNLPDQTYHSPIDVSKAMAREETGPTRAPTEERAAEMGKKASVSVAQVQRYLRGMDYPAGKKEVVNQAQKNNAPGDVLDILRRIKDREFHSAADVSKALGEVM